MPNQLDTLFRDLAQQNDKLSMNLDARHDAAVKAFSAVRNALQPYARLISADPPSGLSAGQLALDVRANPENGNRDNWPLIARVGVENTRNAQLTVVVGKPTGQHTTRGPQFEFISLDPFDYEPSTLTFIGAADAILSAIDMRIRDWMRDRRAR